MLCHNHHNFPLSAYRTAAVSRRVLVGTGLLGASGAAAAAAAKAETDERIGAVSMQPATAYTALATALELSGACSSDLTWAGC